MTSPRPAGAHPARPIALCSVTDPQPSAYRATDDDWLSAETMAAHDSGNGYYAWRCILELRARVEALESKYETQRLATLEWGKDVDKVKRWSDQHLQRIMKLESAQQQPTIKESLTAPSTPQPGPPAAPAPAGSLVNRVALAISGIEYGLERDEEAVNWASEARAAIREVAEWLREQHDGDLVAATVIEQEADR